ncbi:MAG: permease [Candidatus Glassbacteria bacterium RIFCSPLOWO2_12_FULL_58_11]|uniref:Permease n=1 Tax=Candidatus Glassbacteria bacterium RIFCSPLOWO2_12_FULL_58_11 TaxID=1817867 RepID=A0A1F5YVS9_9BACT|nr:MAG: permease [Candidatus Glassbacteria bacterium RIFCSPLOWO2_12_FULL_58_11]
MSLGLLVIITVFTLTFILRMPIAFGMLAGATFYFLVSGQDISLVAEQVLSNLYSKYIILAVPLFVFTAKVMNVGKVTDRVFAFAGALVGSLRGGIGHVNVLASIIFSGMTGSAVADASGLGIMEIRAMRKEGYDDGFSCAITAASATIGPIFPPSIPMVFYAMLSGASVGSLFLGGMLPGLLIGLALMIYIAIIARKRNFPRGRRHSPAEFFQHTFRAIPALITPVILLGGIYTGVVTATEAGAVAAFYGLLISFFIYRAIGFRELYELLVDTVKTCGILAIILGSAFSFSYIVAVEHIPEKIAGLLLDITTNKYLLLLIINILFLILGMFIDTSTITLVFIPMVLPLVEQAGIDLVHFGVMIVLNNMIGLTTPPFGMLLFIVSGVSGTPLHKIIRETLPMIFVLLVVLILITYCPDIVLWLPRTFGN